MSRWTDPTTDDINAEFGYPFQEALFDKTMTVADFVHQSPIPAIQLSSRQFPSPDTAYTHMYPVYSGTPRGHMLRTFNSHDRQPLSTIQNRSDRKIYPRGQHFIHGLLPRYRIPTQANPQPPTPQEALVQTIQYKHSSDTLTGT